MSYLKERRRVKQYKCVGRKYHESKVLIKGRGSEIGEIRVLGQVLVTTWGGYEKKTHKILLSGN